MLMLFGFLGLVAVTAIFYFHHQPTRHRRWRVVLFVIRAAVLCQLLLLLAEPILTLTIQSKKRPALWLLFDGTDSMNIADDLPSDVRAATDRAVGVSPTLSPGEGSKSHASPLATSPNARPLSHRERGREGRLSRIEYLRAWVAKKDQNLLQELAKRFGLQAFSSNRRRASARSTSAVRADRSTASVWPSN